MGLSEIKDFTTPLRAPPFPLRAATLPRPRAKSLRKSLEGVALESRLTLKRSGAPCVSPRRWSAPVRAIRTGMGGPRRQGPRGALLRHVDLGKAWAFPATASQERAGCTPGPGSSDAWPERRRGAQWVRLVPSAAAKREAVGVLQEVCRGSGPLSPLKTGPKSRQGWAPGRHPRGARRRHGTSAQSSVSASIRPLSVARRSPVQRGFVHRDWPCGGRPYADLRPSPRHTSPPLDRGRGSFHFLP